MKLNKLLISLVTSLILVSACNQQPATNDENNTAETVDSIVSQQNNNQDKGYQVTGVASKGPIQNATVEFFELDNNGQVTGNALPTTSPVMTDTNGQWQVSFVTAPAKAVEIVVSGGEYIDEADPSPTNKRTITIGASESLKGVLLPNTTTSSVTILTHALLEKSRAETSANNFFDVLNNNRNTAKLALGFDPFTTPSADPLSPSTSASVDSIEYAMYLGGVATALNSAAIIMGRAVPNYAIMMGMVEDLSDGHLNGKKTTANVQVDLDGDNVAETDFPDSIDLNLAIQRFRNNNFAAYSVTEVKEIVEVNEQILSVPGTNIAPDAVDDSAATISDVAINISNVLANDTDADGDQLSVASFTQPTNGTVTEGSAGSFTFTPESGFIGNTVFSYVASDNRGGEDSGQVVITVTQAPSTTTDGIDPTANAGSDQTVDEETLVSLNGSASIDADGSITSYAWTQVNGATVTINNSTTGTPDFTAPTTAQLEILVFNLTVTDNDGLTDSDSVSIIVNPVNVLPVADAGADQPLANELSTITLDATNSSDSDGTVTGYSWEQVSGTPVTLNNADTDTATFTSPTVLINNVDILFFKLTVTDNNDGQHDDFISVIINPVLIAPTADAGADQTLDESDGITPVTITLDGSGSNDDRSVNEYSWTQIAGSPTIVLSDASAVSPSFTAPDVANDTTFSFQLTVTDDEGGTNTDTVDINLVSLNSGPLVTDDPDPTTDEDTPLLISSLLDNDSDPESDAFTIDSVVQPANGTVVIEAGNTEVTYTPAVNFNGTDTFTYTAIDEFGAISVSSATVTVTVNGVNDDPVAVNDSLTTVQGIPVTLTNATANDTDLENNTLLISGVTQATYGTVVNNNDGTITYTPDLTNAAPDSFDYTIVDGFGGSATGTVNITIIADSDLDAIPDAQEIIDGTDPDLADTDGDGFFDNHEKAAGTSALLNTEMPPGTSVSSTETIPNNIISTDTTWTLANAPYWVQSDVTINAGSTLTIEAGVVIKSNSGIDVIVNGGLVTLGNIPQPQNVIFTAASDDSINGDTDGVVITPGEGAWNGIDFNQNSQGNLSNTDISYANQCVYVENATLILDRMDIGDCSSYGIYGYKSTSGTSTVNLSNINILDIDTNGRSTGSHGMYFYSGGSGTLDLNIDNIVTSKNGNNTAEYGLYLYSNNGHITGSINDLSINDSSGEAVYIYNNGSFNVDPDFNNLTITNPGDMALYVSNDFTGATTPTFDGIVDISGVPSTKTNMYFVNSDPDFVSSVDVTLDGGAYGLSLSNSAGSFRNISINNAAISGLDLANSSDPLVFSNIVLTNSISPYQLNGQNITPAISAGYDFSDVSVAKSYIRVGGTLSNDMTLTADPLGTTTSVWRIYSSITVPSATVLTVEDGAVLKFDTNLVLTVNGTLKVGDGDGLGSKSVFTSILDDSVGDDLGNSTSPGRSDWAYIYARAGSVIDIDNTIIRYNNYGIYQYNEQPTSLDITNSEFSDIYYYGMYLYAGTGHDITWNLGSVTFTDVGINTNYHGIYLDINNNATFTGTWNNITMDNIGGSGIYIDDTSTGVVNPTISGLNIGNAAGSTIGNNAVQLIGDSTTTPTIDASSGSGNMISKGFYNLTLQGVGGSYNNLALDGATSASIYISASADPLGGWDDATVVLTNAPSPYRVLTDFPASIGTFGTADLGYDTVNSTVSESYVTTGGTLTNSTFVADPLNSGTSVYRVVSNISVPSGTTLTVEDGTVLKFDTNLVLSVNGTLKVGDGNGLGAKSIFTSILDDSVGDDLGNATSPGRSDWAYIYARAGSVIDIDNAIIRYNDYGIYQSNEQPTSLDITNSDFSDIYYYGMYLYAGTGHDITWNLNNLSFTDVGINTSYHGIYLDINNNATFTGTWNNLTMDNIGGSGIYIDDTSTGLVNPTISGLNFGSTGTMSRNGVQLIGNSTTQPSIDNSTLVGGNYNLTLQGVGGLYTNLTLQGATLASVYFSNDAAPATWTNVITDDAPSPYELAAMGIPAGVIYNPGLTGFSENYIRLSGTITTDITLSSDPLGIATGTGQATDPTVSYWYSPATFKVGNTATLTINADTLYKFAEGSYLQVESGGTLNINGTPGNEVYLTSLSDDVVGDPSTSAAVANDWYGIYFRTGSNGGSINNLMSWYAYYGVNFESVATDPDFTNLSIDYALYGLYFNATTAIAPSFNNIAINRASNQGLYFINSGFIAPVFTGTKSITGPTSDCIYNASSSSPNIVISGWTLDGCTNGLDIRRAGTYVDNLIRNNSSSGIYVSTTSAITIGNNRIVNNGNASNGGGIDIRGIGATSVIENNLIRHNRANYGAGMYFDGGTISATVRNNLIVENHAAVNVGGVYIYDRSTLQLLNNTISGNTEVGSVDSGTGLFIQDFTNNITYSDNIISDNRDADSLENLNDLSTGSIENFNLEDGNSTNGLTGANSLSPGDLGYEDPGFTEGWYLGATTGPIDSGSDLPVNLGLTGTTTQTDGTLDGLATGNSDNVDMGYHYPTGSITVSGTNSIVIPASPVAINLSETVTFTITPLDGSSAVIGYGLDIQATEATGNGTLGSVVDLGDGTYKVSFTATSASQTNTLTFTVNGVALDAQPVINW